MKVAFVNQPIDTIVPPYQNSVGNCTYGVARAIAESCEVLVYGLKDNHEHVAAARPEDNPQFRFVPSTRVNRLLFRVHRKYSRVVQTWQPISSSGLLYPAYGRDIALDLRKERCDVIHIQHSSQYAAAIKQENPDAKVVLHLHAEWFSQSNLKKLESRLRDVDLLTTVSNYITEKTKKDLPSIAARCETMHNGIDSSEFVHEKSYEALRRRKQKRILYTGAVSPHKGLHVLLDAFKLVVHEFPDVRLDIVGPHGSYPLEENFDLRDRALIQTVSALYPKDRLGAIRSTLSSAGPKTESYVEYLKSMITPNLADKVAIVGMVEPRSSFVDYYYDADVFAFTPIWNEGFGLPPVEAMAAGTPVVATRSGATVETIVDRETGFLVNKNSAEQTAKALLALLTNDSLAESMGRAGRRRALQQFTWHRVAEQMRGRYVRLCQNPSRPSEGLVA